MRLEVAVGAVHGHEMGGLHRAHQLPHIVAVAVARGVDGTESGDVRLHAQARGRVQHARDGHFIAGDGPRTQHEPVALGELHPLHLAAHHAGQRAHGLALAAGADDEQLGRWEGRGLGRLDEDVFRNLDDPQATGETQRPIQASAKRHDLSALLSRQLQQDLDAVDVGAEGGDDELARRRFERIFQSFPADGLGRRVAGSEGIGGIREQQAGAGPAQFFQSRETGETAIHGRGIELEVAAVNDDALGRVDGEAAGVGNAVGDGNPLHGQIFSKGDAAEILHDIQQGKVQPVFLELALHQTERERRAVDWHGPAREEVGQRADVVLMPMGERHAADAIRERLQVGEVRHDAVNARLILGREQQAAIHQQQILPRVDREGVHAEFAEPADGHQAQIPAQGRFHPGFKVHGASVAPSGAIDPG